jgi:hypothetical protein
MKNPIKFTQIKNTVYGTPRFIVLAIDLIQAEEAIINVDKAVLWAELLPLAQAKGRMLGGSVWRGDKHGAYIVFEGAAGLEPLQERIENKLKAAEKSIREGQNLCFDITCNGNGGGAIPKNPTPGDAIAWGQSVVATFRGARKYHSYSRLLAAYLKAGFALKYFKNI